MSIDPAGAIGAVSLSGVLWAIVLAGILAPIAWIDQMRFIIPDALNALLFVAGVIYAMTAGHHSLVEIALGILLSIAVMLALRGAYRSLRGVAGLGLGDVKFIAAAVPWIGPAQLPWLVLFACCSGLVAVVAGSKRAVGDGVMTRIAFGPHLSAGLLLCFMLQSTLEAGVSL